MCWELKCRPVFFCFLLLSVGGKMAAASHIMETSQFRHCCSGTRWFFDPSASSGLFCPRIVFISIRFIFNCDVMRFKSPVIGLFGGDQMDEQHPPSSLVFFLLFIPMTGLLKTIMFWLGLWELLTGSFWLIYWRFTLPSTPTVLIWAGVPESWTEIELWILDRFRSLYWKPSWPKRSVSMFNDDFWIVLNTKVAFFLL